MKKTSAIKMLLGVGTLCTGIGVFIRPYFHFGPNVDDFLKGLGFSLVVGSFIVLVKMKRKVLKERHPPTKVGGYEHSK